MISIEISRISALINQAPLGPLVGHAWNSNFHYRPAKDSEAPAFCTMALMLYTPSAMAVPGVSDQLLPLTEATPSLVVAPVTVEVA